MSFDSLFESVKTDNSKFDKMIIKHWIAKNYHDSGDYLKTI